MAGRGCAAGDFAQPGEWLRIEVESRCRGGTESRWPGRLEQSPTIPDYAGISWNVPSADRTSWTCRQSGGQYRRCSSSLQVFKNWQWQWRKAKYISCPVRIFGVYFYHRQPITVVAFEFRVRGYRPKSKLIGFNSQRSRSTLRSSSFFDSQALARRAKIM